MFFAGLHLAYYAPLPQERVSAQVCEGQKTLVQVAVRSKKTLRVMPKIFIKEKPGPQGAGDRRSLLGCLATKERS
jgi:hypothetical protein